MDTETDNVDEPKRLRMFAGPNGSGKSTLIRTLAKDFSAEGLFQLHRYINADDLLRDLQSDRGIDFAQFDLAIDQRQIEYILRIGGRLDPNHPFFAAFTLTGSTLRVPKELCDSYVAAAIADLLREELLTGGLSFSFETVMSHPNKVEFFARARKAGYRTYLYFIATESPKLNQDRVGNRVELGGHDVPESKIHERYARSLRLVGDALAHAFRAFLFDNSGAEPLLLAELDPEQKLKLKLEKTALPVWFTTHVLPRFGL